MGLIDGLITWFNELITKDATTAVIVGTITAALVGAFVGAFVTYVFQMASDNRRRGQRIVGVLEGICAELNTVYKQLISQYEKEKWKDFKKSSPNQYDPPLFFTGPLQMPKDYAIVYRSNANLIGQIKNSDLRSEIVSIYMSLQIFVNKHEEYRKQYSSFLDLKGAGMHSSLYVNLGESALKLIQNHKSLTRSIKSILEMLEEEVPLYSFFGFCRRFLRFCHCKEKAPGSGSNLGTPFPGNGKEND